MTKETEQYIQIAKSVGVFKDQEIGVLADVLEDYERSPDLNYSLFDDRDNDHIVGFVLFGKTPVALNVWDIYWLAVKKEYQGKGYGRRLIKRVEEFLRKQGSGIIMRVETSTRKEYGHARNLYGKSGFSQAGRLPNFYAPGDDLVIFYKEIALVS